MSAGRRIAVLCSEGQSTKWPADLEVRTYNSTARDAAKVAAMMKGGSIDAVVIANKQPNSTVLRLMPKNMCPVFLWTRTLPALASTLHEVVGLPRMPVLVQAPEPPPDKRPQKWSTEENEAIVVAYSESGEDAAMFHAIYNELVERPRTPAELWLHCESLKSRGYLQATEGFVAALKASAGKLAISAPAATVTPIRDDETATLLKRAVAAGILSIDEAIDRAFSHRVLDRA